MAETPQISVVLSVFNAGVFLREAVESILSQSFTDFECIIIDDGSTDGSSEILDGLQKADPRVRVYRQENSGLISSLNRGCRLARGKYIARMDADDVALANRFELQFSYMERHPEVAAAGSWVEFIDEAGQALGAHRYATEPGQIQTLVLDQNIMWHPTAFLRREAIESVGGYRNVLDAEDYDLWLRMTDEFSLANIPQVLLKYRIHSAQVSERKNKQMMVSALSCRAAAFARRSGNPDVLEGLARITEETLLGLVRDTRPLDSAQLAAPTDLQSATLRSYFRWILQAAHHNPTCLRLAIEALRSNYWQRAAPQMQAEAFYTRARLHWVAGQRIEAGLAALHALRSYPAIAGRVMQPVWKALRRFDRGDQNSSGAVTAEQARGVSYLSARDMAFSKNGEGTR